MSIFRTSITRCNHTDNECPIIIHVHPDIPMRCLNKKKYDHGLSRRHCNGSQSNESGLFNGHCNGSQSETKHDPFSGCYYNVSQSETTIISMTYLVGIITFQKLRLSMTHSMDIIRFQELRLSMHDPFSGNYNVSEIETKPEPFNGYYNVSETETKHDPFSGYYNASESETA